MKIVFATGNRGKLAEAAEILGPGYELLTPRDLGLTEDIPETGMTLRENSIQKARYIYDRLGCDCFADDTGLEVDALDGAPGVFSARYAGPECDFKANVAKLLRELEGVPYEQRTARFKCVVTLILGGRMHFFEGRCEGHIALQPAGDLGFGYDPVFIADQFAPLTFAQVGPDQKNIVSHRGQSLRALAAGLSAVSAQSTLSDISGPSAVSPSGAPSADGAVEDKVLNIR